MHETRLAVNVQRSIAWKVRSLDLVKGLAGFKTLAIQGAPIPQLDLVAEFWQEPASTGTRSQTTSRPAVSAVLMGADPPIYAVCVGRAVCTVASMCTTGATS